MYGPGGDDVRALRPLRAQRRHHAPRLGEDLTFAHARLHDPERRVHRRFRHGVGEAQAGQLVLGLDDLGLHEHVVVAVDEVRLREGFLQLLLHQRAPQVHADGLAVERPGDCLDLRLPALHRDLLAEVRSRMDLVGMHPRHPLLAVLEIHHVEVRFAAARQDDRPVPRDVGGSEMVAVARQVAGVLGPEDEQGVEPGILQRLLPAGQTLTVHPDPVEPLLPVDRHGPQIGHPRASFMRSGSAFLSRGAVVLVGGW